MANENINTNHALDVICSLQLTWTSLQQTAENNLTWKWVIISLHSAFQGAMVCHLSDTNQFDAFKAKDEQKWLVWHESDTNQDNVRDKDAPRLKLVRTGELFDRISDSERAAAFPGQDNIEVGEDQRKAFDELCGFRNDFTHFTPKSWIIPIAELPNLVFQIVSLIESISNDGWAFRHLDENERLEFVALIELLKTKSLKMHLSFNEGE